MCIRDSSGSDPQTADVSGIFRSCLYDACVSAGHQTATHLCRTTYKDVYKRQECRSEITLRVMCVLDILVEKLEYLLAHEAEEEDPDRDRCV